MSKDEILLHACCATCAGYTLQKTAERYVPVIYYCNPNIHPLGEYTRRRDELRDYAKRQGIRFIEEPYDPDEWLATIQGLEEEPEKGRRCEKCFALRLNKAASFAVENSLGVFTTTLTISPHKNSKVILDLGDKISKDLGIYFWAEDFKKKDGFKKTMEIARTEGFYRQTFCGCFFSQRTK